MQMHEVEELKEVDSVAKANIALADGWTLVAVAPTPDDTPIYVLGRRKPRDRQPEHVPVNSERHDGPRR